MCLLSHALLFSEIPRILLSCIVYVAIFSVSENATEEKLILTIHLSYKC